jgi:hypothetical protein
VLNASLQEERAFPPGTIERWHCLSQKEREYQETVLRRFIEGSNYENSALLAGWVSNGLCEIAARRALATMDANMATMWALNQASKARSAVKNSN